VSDVPNFCSLASQLTLIASLVFVLASGAYLSSFIKDLVCSPRPFSPPVTRLSESRPITRILFVTSHYSYWHPPSRVRVSLNSLNSQCIHGTIHFWPHSSCIFRTFSNVQRHLPYILRHSARLRCQYCFREAVYRYALHRRLHRRCSSRCRNMDRIHYDVGHTGPLASERLDG